jgi:ketosteroid isomerase-like protein
VPPSLPNFVLRTYSLVSELILVDGDRAATLSRQYSRRTVDGHAVSYRVANFMRFRDGKLVNDIIMM